MKQQTLAMVASFEGFGRQSWRAEFLSQMELVVPWGELVKLVEPHYPASCKGCRPVHRTPPSAGRARAEPHLKTG